VDLRQPPDGGWGGVAFAVLQSETTPAGPQTAIATISETGQLDIRVIPVPPDNDQRHSQSVRVRTWRCG